MKLAIADRSLALIPINMQSPGMEGAVLVHPSSLLDALTELFERTWQESIPVHSVGSDSESEERSPHLTHLVSLLAAGYKDDVIARHLGIGVRTVRRRIKALMTQLGADTRFQAGLQAAREEWL